MMKIGIIGSRRYRNKTFVKRVINLLPSDTRVISGGCDGVDTWAVQYAKKLGLKTHEFIPEFQSREAFFSRNRLIAINTDVLIAFIPLGQMRSGAWNTINYQREFKKPYVVFDEHGDTWDREWKTKTLIKLINIHEQWTQIQQKIHKESRRITS
ncbi:MAG: hypothetical protein GF411_03120 [Candidatus Lokiarchaeota archaeon]|nr:hypothetical protein [Candidatus Lokiarchaeota archaeon]